MNKDIKIKAFPLDMHSIRKFIPGSIVWNLSSYRLRGDN